MSTFDGEQPIVTDQTQQSQEETENDTTYVSSVLTFNKTQNDRRDFDFKCRNLMVRGIDNDVDPEEVIEHFRQFGTFKDPKSMIPDKGMFFITFFDIRDAIKAYTESQSTKFNEIPIQVTYNIPRTTQAEDPGTITLFMTDSNHNFHSFESQNALLKLVETYGEIKEIRGGRGSQAYVEFFDQRGADRCLEAFKNTETIDFLDQKTRVDVRKARVLLPQGIRDSLRRGRNKRRHNNHNNHYYRRQQHYPMQQPMQQQHYYPQQNYYAPQQPQHIHPHAKQYYSMPQQQQQLYYPPIVHHSAHAHHAAQGYAPVQPNLAPQYYQTQQHPVHAQGTYYHTGGASHSVQENVRYEYH
ncbi:hypothetical protein PCE1_000749 [Barthelona sp. PCE]